MKNRLKADYLKTLDEYIQERIFITETDQELRKEIEVNYWGIGGAKAQIRSLTKGEWREYMERLIADRQKQLDDSKVTTDMIFYCYHDQQSGHLCFNIISAAHHSLPFRARYEAYSLDHIISSFRSDGAGTIALVDENYLVRVFSKKLIKQT
jgi:hypothetical protein